MYWLLSYLFFFMSAYAVIANDSIQILGTWMVSNKNVKWYWLATYASFGFAIILVFFKEFSSIPMSTTWVFIVLLSRRELSISWVTPERDFKTVFPIIRQDFTKLIIGMGVSVFVAWLVNQVK